MRRAVQFTMMILLIACTQCTRSDRERPKEDQTPEDSIASAPEKKWSNERFRDVTVTSKGNHRYLIEGEGQIFEASFNWVVEDGHVELQKGFQTTDAGAPEWGKFSFTVEVEKPRPNSTLTLILFEASAMDGSRQHELPIVLE